MIFMNIDEEADNTNKSQPPPPALYHVKVFFLLSFAFSESCETHIFNLLVYIYHINSSKKTMTRVALAENRTSDITSLYIPIQQHNILK